MNRYYTLNYKVTNNIFYQILKEANNHKIKFNIETDIETIDKIRGLNLYEKFDEIFIKNLLTENEIYELIGFIEVENVKIKNVELVDEFNTLIFYEEAVWFTGNYKQLEKTMMKLGLNAKYWIKEEVKP